MRYLGQGHEIPVEFDPAAVSGIADFVANLRNLYEAEYRRQFSKEIPAGEVEVLSWGLTVSATLAISPPEATAAAAAVPLHPGVWLLTSLLSTATWRTLSWVVFLLARRHASRAKWDGGAVGRGGFGEHHRPALSAGRAVCRWWGPGGPCSMQISGGML